MNIAFRPWIRMESVGLIWIDLLAALLSPILALCLRLDGMIDWPRYGLGLLLIIPCFLVTKIACLIACSVYRCYWRHAGLDEVMRLVFGVLLAGIANLFGFSVLFTLAVPSISNLPRSLPFLDALVSFVLILGIHLSIRALATGKQRYHQRHVSQSRVLVIGAGVAGIAFVNSLWTSPHLELQAVGFVDDDPHKRHLKIRGIPVLGDRHQLAQIVRQQQIDKIIIAMPTAPGFMIRELMQMGRELGIATLTLPGIDEILRSPHSLTQTRELRLEDLLRREPIQTNIEEVRRFLGAKRVLVTGAGGSIGSEVCRQILRAEPTTIILVGKGENSIFLIQQELERAIQELKAHQPERLPEIKAIIADIRNRKRLEHIFESYRPSVIFHAAAHKHVPLMELNPPEAISSNVIGTKNLVDLAVQFDVQNLVMISTDKAVNPTNIMGASKRMAEMVVLQAAQRYQRAFVVVRFGNVLGSRGSVVPTFQRQIQAGGPITITHPDVCRYFMTIPEAVQLVLQASVLGRGGEVFMLDMGQPVKIVDLAKDLIRLAGYEVDRDIKLLYSGLRPGEKLYEELFIPGEVYERTKHQTILTVPNASRQLPAGLDHVVLHLVLAAAKNDYSTLVNLLKSHVVGYQPNPNGVVRLSQTESSTVDSSPELKTDLEIADPDLLASLQPC